MTNARHSSAPTVHDSKRAWRRWAGQLPGPDPEASTRIAERLAAYLSDVDGIVLGYVALGDEVDIAAVLGSRPVGSIALPRLDADGRLSLHLDDGERELHRFGVAQPRQNAVSIALDDVAVVLVPGRIFDHRGYRLGRGGGHYDRLLADVDVGTPTVGVVTADRVVALVPTEDHDRPMSHLATEHGVDAVDD